MQCRLKKRKVQIYINEDQLTIWHSKTNWIHWCTCRVKSKLQRLWSFDCMAL